MPVDFESPRFRQLLQQLSDEPCPDVPDAWPGDQLAQMAAAGVTTWDAPHEFGGLDLSSVEMLTGLQHLASACLVSTFVLTQRSAAVRRIATSSCVAARERLLPGLVAGTTFATVGISHLTTSGQHLARPQVQVVPAADGFVLTGLAPWATGATQADVLITGGTLQDGTEILAAVPTDREGVQVAEPVQLLGLNASQTGSVRLDNVHVAHEEVLHGPVERVMQQGTGGGAGSLGTSALAVGATRGMLTRMGAELQRRPDLCEFANPLSADCEQLESEIQSAAQGSHPAGDAAVEQIRRRANSLVLRTAQSWLAVTKGAGYVAGHPAERAVRESMFFLVWSCPQPVLAANLRELSCVDKS